MAEMFVKVASKRERESHDCHQYFRIFCIITIPEKGISPVPVLYNDWLVWPLEDENDKIILDVAEKILQFAWSPTYI